MASPLAPVVPASFLSPPTSQIELPPFQPKQGKIRCFSRFGANLDTPFSPFDCSHPIVHLLQPWLPANAKVSIALCVDSSSPSLSLSPCPAASPSPTEARPCGNHLIAPATLPAVIQCTEHRENFHTVALCRGPCRVVDEKVGPVWGGQLIDAVLRPPLSNTTRCHLPLAIDHMGSQESKALEKKLVKWSASVPSAPFRGVLDRRDAGKRVTTWSFRLRDFQSQEQHVPTKSSDD